MNSVNESDGVEEILEEVKKANQVGKMELPRSLDNYLKSPKITFYKLRDWLNAQWQLRKCTSVGRWPRVIGRVFIQNEGEIVFGERVLIYSHYAHSVYASFKGGRIEIGNRTVLNYGVDIAATKLVKIGEGCLIGTHAIILDNDFHEVNERDRVPEPKPVIIGNHVWMGNRVMVLPGVTIGDGSVIGAGSVVMTDIPANSVAMGNPARVIKKL